MLSNYPPGHPTGTRSSRYSTRCRDCGSVYFVGGDYERDTNALVLDEDDELRCDCGADLSGSDYSWNEDPLDEYDDPRL